jgi:hypothetical protein
MNERIRELVEQAGFYVADGKIYIPSTSEEITTCQKKFAELIVRECADIVANKVTLETNEDYREGFHRAQQFIWQDINKHFGVSDAVL